MTCTFSTGCALRRRDMPQNRLWAVEAERERRARLDRNAPVLAKWLWLLFWLVIPSVFSNILTMDTVAGAFPTAGVVGNVLAFLISLAYGVLLWQLLWKWWIGLLLGLLGCIFLALISAILGLLAILADAIGLLVVGIVKLVYLYWTAKRFREYQPAALQKEVL